MFVYNVWHSYVTTLNYDFVLIVYICIDAVCVLMCLVIVGELWNSYGNNFVCKAQIMRVEDSGRWCLAVVRTVTCVTVASHASSCSSRLQLYLQYFLPPPAFGHIIGATTSPGWLRIFHRHYRSQFQTVGFCVSAPFYGGSHSKVIQLETVWTERSRGFHLQNPTSHLRLFFHFTFCSY